MSFSDTVKQDALIACGRFCSICHKFCGIKMELHHIKPTVNKGDDTFDNCIPLCLDCHADMSSYDFKHPKGTKYSEQELKRHRNNWYTKVKDSPGISSSNEYTMLDRATFSRLKALLPWKGSIFFLRQEDFQESFTLSSFADLSNFNYTCEDPAFEFTDADLEGARANLRESVDRFLRLVGVKTYPTNNPDRNAVPAEWRHQKPEQFKDHVDILCEFSAQILERYDTLIKLGRRKLSVD